MKFTQRFCVRPKRAYASSLFRRAARSGVLDLHQELAVALGLLEALEQELEGLLSVECGEHTTQLPDDRDLVLAHEEFLAASTRLDGVDRREDPLLGEVAAQPDLHVAGALELLEDHLVNLGAGLDERGREDGERATVLDVARGTE